MWEGPFKECLFWMQDGTVLLTGTNYPIESSCALLTFLPGVPGRTSEASAQAGMPCAYAAARLEGDGLVYL